MKSTLEKYIDPENIPQAYGGKLPFKFGDMPLLDPTIISALDTRFSDCEGLPTQRGEPTLPIGPIKWREAPAPNSIQQQMEAICVGRESDSGKLRQNIIARVHTDFRGMHGIVRAPGQPAQNTPIDWSLEKVVSTTGTSTQPEDEEEEANLYYGADLTSGTTTPQVLSDNNIKGERNGRLPLPPAMALEISKNGPVNTSATMAANLVETNHDSLPVGESWPRTDASETRYEQQAGTHAAGQLDEVTPHVVDYGRGEKTATVQPTTVGQALKDVRTDLLQPEEPSKPGIFEPAKEVVGQAYDVTTNAKSTVVSNVIAVVGLGGKEENTEEKEEEEGKGKPTDDKVKAIEDRKCGEVFGDQISEPGC